MELLLKTYLKNFKNDSVKFKIITPKDPHQRGCQLSLKFVCDIHLIYKELIKRGIAVRDFK